MTVVSPRVADPRRGMRRQTVPRRCVVGRESPSSLRPWDNWPLIGKRTGVANILGVNFSGFIAW